MKFIGQILLKSYRYILPVKAQRRETIFLISTREQMAEIGITRTQVCWFGSLFDVQQKQWELHWALRNEQVWDRSRGPERRALQEWAMAIHLFRDRELSQAVGRKAGQTLKGLWSSVKALGFTLKWSGASQDCCKGARFGDSSVFLSRKKGGRLKERTEPQSWRLGL